MGSISEDDSESIKMDSSTTPPNKPQIISINRATEPSPAYKTESTSPPEPGRKVITTPTTGGGDRPQRRPASPQRRGGFRPRQPAPDFLAHGIIEGALNREDGKLVFDTSDGTRLYVAGIDPGLAVVLMGAGNWEGDVRRWFVYPQSPRFKNSPIGWYFKSYNPELPLEIDQFRVWCSGGKYPGTVFVGRSDPKLRKQRDFTILPIDNAPELPEQQPAKWLCHREGDRLVWIGEDTLPPPNSDQRASQKPRQKGTF